MLDIFEILSEYSYFGILLILIGVNASPILMPPSWIILTSFHLLDPTLNIVLLAMVGATGATIGRFFLKNLVDILEDLLEKSKNQILIQLEIILIKKSMVI